MDWRGSARSATGHSSRFVRAKAAWHSASRRNPQGLAARVAQIVNICRSPGLIATIPSLAAEQLLGLDGFCNGCGNLFLPCGIAGLKFLNDATRTD